MKNWQRMDGSNQDTKCDLNLSCKLDTGKGLIFHRLGLLGLHVEDYGFGAREIGCLNGHVKFFSISQNTQSPFSLCNLIPMDSARSISKIKTVNNVERKAKTQKMTIKTYPL